MKRDPSPSYDVAIIGGGPAGLSAAFELKRLGVPSVIVIERESVAGGIPRHCGHSPFGMREFLRVLSGPNYTARLVEQARSAGAEILTQATATALHPGPRIAITTRDGLSEISARRVLIATGAREKSRAARLIGGTKPGGVLSTGALQGLVYLDRETPFRRPVILGTELVSFSALLTCRHAGMRPVAMIEPGVRITAWRASRLLPALLGVPLMLDTKVTAVRGGSRVEAVEVRDASGAVRTIEADGLIVSGQFLPEAALLGGSHIRKSPSSGGPEFDQFLRLSDPDYFAAGNMLRPIETAGWCWSEGRTAARMIVKSLAGELPDVKDTIGIAITGDALKYVAPQRLGTGKTHGALEHLQLRVKRAARGTLSLVVDGHPVWSQKISALPERRLLIPFERLPRGITGDTQLVLTED
jgi:thioredoxin reductase